MEIVSRLAAVLALACVLAPSAPPAWASAQTDLASARAAGQSVFLVVTEAPTPGREAALALAARARALAPHTAVVALDRGLPENQDLVRSLRLLGAPVPVVLVVAPNGVVAGGALLKDATPEALVGLIPTPRKADVLMHLSRGTAVIVVVSRPAMADARSAVFEACNEAVRRLAGQGATVVLDLDDEAERRYVRELGVGEREAAPVVVVFNKKGQKTAVFRIAVTAPQLVEAVQKQAQCCPGGNC
jgi:hypothetical protein